jgi:SAM-dependent methyltransferase
MLNTAGVFSVVTCSSCGAGRTLPTVPDEALDAYYPTGYHAHSLGGGLLYRFAWTLGQRLHWGIALRRWPLDLLTDVGPGGVLDVGCGRGDLGAALIRRGWRVAGIDPSGPAVTIARSRGLDATVGTLQSTDLVPAAFDAVTMIHALEHVSDPVEDLRLAHSALRPGGTLIVLVPNFNSWGRRRFGNAWYHLDLPRHRTHFTPTSLQHACGASGFVEVIVTTGFDPGGLVGTLRYRCLGRPAGGSPVRRCASHVVTLVLSPLTWLLNKLAGGGDLLLLAARRPDN